MLLKIGENGLWEHCFEKKEFPLVHRSYFSDFQPIMCSQSIEKSDREPKCAVGAPTAFPAPAQRTQSASAVAWEGYQQFSLSFTQHNFDILE